MIDRRKKLLFAAKAPDCSQIVYAAAVNGSLQLVPIGEGAKALAEDYARMVDEGPLLEEAEPFEMPIERCADIAGRANGSAG